ALIWTALLLIALDFSLGQITLISWLFLIPISLAGGLIVTRPGFNSLVTLSILGIFGAYFALVYLQRVPLTLSVPPDLLVSLSVALGVVLLILNALVESLVAYLYQTQEAFLKTRVQYLQTLNDLEQIRRELADTQRQVRRIERLSTIGHFAGQLSKTLRTPLETMEIALNQPSETLCQPDLIAKLRHEIATAVRLTDGLQHLADLGRLHIETVNLDDLLAEELAHIHIPENVSISVEQPPVFPSIQADSKQIRLLMHHLIDNAIRAVEEEGGEIRLALASDPEGVRLSVSDNGPGIPEEQLELIFEPLYTTQQQGFGLGLAICQQVVQMHGGQITVDSVVDEGTTFTVSLPRVPRHPPEELAQDSAG
ncbi:MAG TPA: HAMP domain-containing histidine kinase, partial [Caldilineae bacterium]|nr:HAMP domain-containing histidine kinase [Caldilineae bacterium]